MDNKEDSITIMFDEIKDIDMIKYKLDCIKRDYIDSEVVDAYADYVGMTRGADYSQKSENSEGWYFTDAYILGSKKMFRMIYEYLVEGKEPIQI